MPDNEAPGSREKDNARSDDELVLHCVRALLDQLRLDPSQSLQMESLLTDELGIDSLATVELCDQLETQFGVALPDEVLLTNLTPKDWLQSIRLTKDERTAPDIAVGTEDLGAVAPPPPRQRRAKPTNVEEQVTHDYVAGPGPWIYVLYAWTLTVPFALIIWTLAVLPLSTTTARRTALPLGRLYCRLLGVKVRVHGTLPSTTGPLVITPNHSSFIDGLILYIYLDEPVVFVSSVELERQPIFGRILKKFGCVFVQRGRAERGAEAVGVLVDALARGGRIVIFPEGSLGAQTALRPFHLGAFWTASSSDALVVPVGIRGSRSVLPPSSVRPQRGAIHVYIGRALVSQGTTFAQRVALRDETYTAIAGLIGGPQAR